MTLFCQIGPGYGSLHVCLCFCVHMCLCVCSMRRPSSHIANYKLLPQGVKLYCLDQKASSGVKPLTSTCTVSVHPYIVM